MIYSQKLKRKLMETQRNERLWKEAEARSGFKKHLSSYVLVNLFLIGVWYFKGGAQGGNFWPVWTLLGWGIGLLSHYLGVYGKNRFFSTEKEYEDLVKAENPNRNP